MRLEALSKRVLALAPRGIVLPVEYLDKVDTETPISEASFL
jgi:hypothetical protein